MNNERLPKVTVIIPVYNVEKYLVQCLDSVKNQSLEDIEVLCIDDCSTDSSASILKSYAQQDPRFLIFHNKSNRGPSYSRNKGIKKANGQYIYFLDSDDMITQTALEELYNKAVQKRADIIYFDADLIYESEGLALKHNNYKAEHKKIYEGVYKGECLFTKFIVNDDWSPSPPRQFFRSDFLKSNKILFYEGILHEDHLFWFKSALQAKRALCIYDKFFIRRYRENSIMTSQRSIKNLEGMFTCYCEMLFSWNKSSLAPETNLAVNQYINIILDAAKSMYNGLVQQNGDVVLQTNDARIQCLYKTILQKEDNSRICGDLDEKKISRLRSCRNVIIYGAGVVAREVIHILDKNNVGILGFAVSDKEGDPEAILGNKVYCIDELTNYADESIVLVATTKRYYPNILKQLNNLNFNNVIFALDGEEHDYNNTAGA